MLPPFVPPSARVASETLPLITDFVIDLAEQSFDSSFSRSGGSVGLAVATLPSIDEFVRSDEPAPEHQPPSEPERAAQPKVAAAGPEEEPLDEFVQRTSRSPWGEYEARHEATGAAEAAQPASATIEPDLHPTESLTPPSGSEDAILNEIAEPADAWAASAAGGRADDERHDSAADVTRGAEGGTSGAPPITPEIWVAEERDAFDWHAAANLAVPPAEDQRAAEEWSSTEWERSSGSVQDHVATLLAQISRRVRSGELEVQGSKQMGAEAALVAALAAMLGESAK